MAEVAREAEVEPTQLSFTVALHYIRHEWGWRRNCRPTSSACETASAILLYKKRGGEHAPASSNKFQPDIKLEKSGCLSERY
jgi:hypothetical protein